VKHFAGGTADACWTDEQVHRSSNRKQLGAERDPQDAAELVQEDEPFHEVAAADNDRQRFQGGSTDDGSW
jgi:hypothetical protein